MIETISLAVGAGLAGWIVYIWIVRGMERARNREMVRERLWAIKRRSFV
jgi:hypothetical protein